MRAWWRGAGPPIAIVMIMVFVSVTSFRKVIGWQWPVVRWTMYETKAKTAPSVKFRRFVVDHADGRREGIGLGRAFAFLDKPYRLDRGMDRNLVGFLEVVLRRLHARYGHVALTYERHSWDYRERSLEEHFAAPPASAFRLAFVDFPPAALREGRPSGDLLDNGTFRKARTRSGWPRTWETEALRGGYGLEAGGKDRALLLSPSPGPQSVHQVVTAPAGALRLIALVRTTAPGAVVELETAAGATRAEAPADGAWHAVEVLGTAPAAGEVKVILRSEGAAEVLFDDVALYPGGG